MLERCLRVVNPVLSAQENEELLGAISTPAIAVHIKESRSPTQEKGKVENSWVNKNVPLSCVYLLPVFTEWHRGDVTLLISHTCVLCRHTAPCKTSWCRLDGGYCATRSTDTLPWSLRPFVTQRRFCSLVSLLETPSNPSSAQPGADGNVALLSASMPTVCVAVVRTEPNQCLCRNWWNDRM